MSFPCAFIGHGGGPLPLLGKHPELVDNFKQFIASLPSKPSAVVVVTAHWREKKGVAVSTGDTHSLLFDYGGFPPESYRFIYPAPGKPELALRIIDLISKAGVPCRADDKRGWDHGVFVPMMMMFPEADVPVVALSLQDDLDPETHITIGQALAPLREENVLIYGSGAVCHNFEYIFNSSPAKQAEGNRFADQWTTWLIETLVDGSSLTAAERLRQLARWTEAPGGTAMHPPRGGQDHLIPLHVIAGAALGTTAKPIEAESMFGMGDFLNRKCVNGFVWR